MENDNQGRVTHEKKHECCNTKCLFTKEELGALRQQVLDLNEMIVSLENKLQIKDVKCSDAQRMNELVLLELRKKCHSNRILKQQLEEERLLYRNRRDYLDSKTDVAITSCYNVKDEIIAVKEQLLTKTQTAYALEDKLLQMKYARDMLKEKLKHKSVDHIRIIAEMLEKLDEAERELNIIISTKFHEPLPASKAKFLQIVQRNARLVYENAALKAQLRNSHVNVHKSRKSHDKLSMAHDDSKGIKSTTDSVRWEDTKKYPRWPIAPEDKESKDFSLTYTMSQDSVDQASDGKDFHGISQANNTTLHTNAREIQTEASTHSKPQVESSADNGLRATTEARSPHCVTDYSIDSCDPATNK